MYFTIITVCYNASETIGDAIKSLHSQTFQDYGHIIIDGASTDNTLRIINELKTKDTVVVSEPDNGMYDALNKGLRKANGSVIGFLHSDDIYHSPYVLQWVYEALQDSKTDAVFGDLEYVRKENPEKILRYWKSKKYAFKNIKKGWMPPHPTFFVKKKIYDQYGYFDSSMEISADYEIMLRFLGKYRISATYIPRVLVKMKTGGASNRSLQNIILKSYEDYQAIKRYKVGGLPTLFLKNISKIKQFL